MYDILHFALFYAGVAAPVCDTLKKPGLATGLKKRSLAMKTYNVISLGGGVQSTVLVLLSLHDIIERADCAVFADTGWERKATYENVEKLRGYAKDFDFPIHTVYGETANGYRNIREELLNPKHNNFVKIPTYYEGGGKKGQMKRECTNDYKQVPIKKFMLSHFEKGAMIYSWIGISLDEAKRMSSRQDHRRIKKRYPLVELRWSRAKCLEWLKESGFGIPSKSSCIGCPFHSKGSWLALNKEEQQDAIEVDEQIRDMHKSRTGRMRSKPTHKDQVEAFDLTGLSEKNDSLSPNEGVFSSETTLYLHSQRVPLKEFFAEPDAYQAELFDLEDESGCVGNCFT